MAVIPVPPAPFETHGSIFLSGSTDRGNKSGHALPIRTPSVQTAALLDTIIPDVVVDRGPITSQTHKVYGRHSLVRRDSLERREALLKGREGSRQRRRWENGA